MIRHGFRIDPSASAFDNFEVARRLVKLMILPHDEPVLRARSTASALAQAYDSVISSAHNLLLLDNAIGRTQAIERACNDRAAKAEADRMAAEEAAQATAKAAEEAAQSARDREEAFRDEIARLRSEADKVLRVVEERKSALVDCQQELQEVQTALNDTQLLLKAKETALETSETALSIAQAEAVVNKAQLESAKEQCRLNQEEMEAAKQSAKQSVESFKKSDEYEAAMIEASQQFYVYGFERCKREVGEKFPVLDLTDIVKPVFRQEGAESETEEEESEEQASESAPELVSPIIDLTDEPAADALDGETPVQGASTVHLNEDIPVEESTEITPTVEPTQPEPTSVVEPTAVPSTVESTQPESIPVIEPTGLIETVSIEDPTGTTDPTESTAVDGSEDA